jgi:hypothetical protein
MDFTKVPTPTLLKTWENLKKGLDEVAKSLDSGSFHTAGPKGAAPPSQAGQTTLWFAKAVFAELDKRGAFKNAK